VNADLMKRTRNPAAKFLHCLPAFHAPNTSVGTEIMNAVSKPDGLEVTDEVFESAASIVFDQAENRHPPSRPSSSPPSAEPVGESSAANVRLAWPKT
jgi:ornithine carbamoyltransferase